MMSNYEYVERLKKERIHSMNVRYMNRVFVIDDALHDLFFEISHLIPRGGVGEVGD